MTGQWRSRERRTCIVEVSVKTLFTESDAFELVKRVIRISLEAIETNVFHYREQSPSIYPNCSYSYSLSKFKTGKMSFCLVSSFYGTLKNGKQIENGLMMNMMLVRVLRRNRTSGMCVCVIS